MRSASVFMEGGIMGKLEKIRDELLLQEKKNKDDNYRSAYVDGVLDFYNAARIKKGEAGNGRKNSIEV